MDKWLNGGVDTEWTDPDAPPYYEDIREGVDALEEPIDDELVEDMYRQAAAHIEKMKDDPSQQNYLQRLDTKGLIQTQKEYDWCLQNRIPMKTIPYGMAVELLKQMDAQKRKDSAKKKARKVAKKSRKKNR